MQKSAQPPNRQVLGAPVKLEGFAQLEVQGNEAHAPGGLALFLFPLPTEGVDLGLAAAVTQGTDGLEVGVDGAPLALAAVRVGLEPLDELVFVRIQQTRCALPFGVARLGHLGLGQVASGGVSGDVEPPGGFAYRDVVAQHQAAQFTEGSHVDHSYVPLHKKSAGYGDNVAQL